MEHIWVLKQERHEFQSELFDRRPAEMGILLENTLIECDGAKYRFFGSFAMSLANLDTYLAHRG